MLHNVNTSIREDVERLQKGRELFMRDCFHIFEQKKSLGFEYVGDVPYRNGEGSWWRCESLKVFSTVLYIILP